MKRLATFLSLAIIISLVSSFSYAAEDIKRTATIVEMQGKAQVKSQSGEWIGAEIGMVLSEGAVIKTEEGSTALVYLEGGDEAASVEVKEKSELKLAQLFTTAKEGSNKTLLDLALGEILITSKKLRSEKSKFEVKTPTSIVGVRGTTFSVSVETE